MKRQYIVVHSEVYRETTTGAVVGALAEGYVIDPIVGRPIVADQYVHWLLVKYESEEERPEPEGKQGEFDDVVETREMPHGMIPEGFTVHAVYQKNLIVMKRKPKEEKP